jgi:hypothetical protein
MMDPKATLYYLSSLISLAPILIYPEDGTTKIMGNMEKTNLQAILLIKTGLPGDRNFGGTSRTIPTNA